MESAPEIFDLDIEREHIFAHAVDVVGLIEQDDRVFQIQLHLASNLPIKQVLVWDYDDIGTW